MTNGEKIKEIFPSTDSRLDKKTGIMLVKWVDGATKCFKAEWWNAEYKEPTPKNDLGVDCIPRIEVIDYLCKHCPDDGECFKDCDEIKHLRQMPSVTPQEPMVIPIAEVKFDEDKLKELVDRAVLTVTPQEPRWIPISERLPKAGEYVGDVAKYYLVQNEYGDMLVARYTHSGYWEQIYQLKPYTDEIVAWMPLPKAYSEVEK